MENEPGLALGSVAGAGIPLAGVERYGRYCLIERIGRGGMAEVFRAVAEGVEGFRRVFVIKRLRPEKSASVELMRMFVDEARLSALLHHPNIVQVYDFGQINGTYFLAMEYLRGKDLAAVMKALRVLKSAVSAPIAAHVAHQVATGLHYAHTLTRVDGQRLEVVHRDVTPSNIMLQRTGAVKVLDFGIAQTTNLARQVQTGGGRVKGKLAYLSPEQVRLEPLDARSDVFALGVVLWEMLTGRRLFAAENEFLTMRGVLTHPIPAPSSIWPSIPAPVDAIVARALERERARRYPSAQDMADDLERFLQAAPCHSQAQGRLLHDLFGEESVELTPDFPTLGLAAGSGAPALAPSPASEMVLEMDAEVPPASAAAELALGLAAVTVAARATPAPIPTSSRPPPASPSLASRRTLVRRTVAAAAGATLIACFSWAAWHGRQAAPVTVHLTATAPILPAAPSRPRAAAIPLAEVGLVPGDIDPAPNPPAPNPPAPNPPAPDPRAPNPRAPDPRAPDPPPPRARTPKKRAARHLSSDVTIDPFK